MITAASGCAEKRKNETLTIAFSNDLEGEIRSCGCPTDDFGGLGRRATFLRIVADTTENFLLVDAGDFFGAELDFGPEKAEITIKSMVLMDYDAVVIGEKDLGFGLDFILDKSAEYGLPVIVSNLRYAATNELVFPPHKITVLSSGLKVGLIGVMHPRLKLPPQVIPGSILIDDPAEAVKTEIEALRGNVDIIVLLAHADQRGAQNLAREFPEIDVVVHGHQGRPTRKAQKQGRAYVMQTTRQGQYMGVAFAVLNEDRKIRSLATQFERLSDKFSEDEAVVKIFKSYGMSVFAKEKADLPPAIYEAQDGVKNPFPGSESCKDCHLVEFEQWLTTKHAGAFETLIGESRQTDRDCVPCHTTGFYKRGGFENLEKTPHLTGVGCESCHGNGHDHGVNPETATATKPETTCRGCHTDEWTPDFDFAVFWGRIQH